jgi:hypothetical protein
VNILHTLRGNVATNLLRAVYWLVGVPWGAVLTVDLAGVLDPEAIEHGRLRVREILEGGL